MILVKNPSVFWVLDMLFDDIVSIKKDFLDYLKVDIFT